MQARRLKPQTDAYVYLDLGRGVIAVLLFDEYRTALKRGKMIKRSARRVARVAEQAVRDEARRLNWIGE